MKLRFIGKDGSMGLKHGDIYNCAAYTERGYIWIAWTTNKTGCQECPYSSLKTLLANWENVKND